MKKGLLMICAIAVVLGITSGALAGASAKQTSRLCVYVDHTHRGASHLDLSTNSKYSGMRRASSASRVGGVPPGRLGQG